MSINGITSLNQYTTHTTNTQNQTKTLSTATNTKTYAKADKSISYNDTAGRIATIPNLGQYEDLIKRFLSGESEMESADKPLSEDQIALRGLMREYMRTDNRSTSQIAASMEQSSKNFLDYWMKTSSGGPTPGHMLSADGSFKIFNSKAEKDEFMKNQKLDFLKNVMSVINTQKDSTKNGVDLKV